MHEMNTYKHYWKIKYWMSRPGWGNSGFVLSLSPEFVQDSKELAKTVNHELLQGRAAEIVSGAGWDIMLHETFIFFNEEFGVSFITVPGNACDIGVDFSGGRKQDGSVEMTPHNVDGPLQQSTLMALWMLWANAVEGA